MCQQSLPPSSQLRLCSHTRSLVASSPLFYLSTCRYSINNNPYGYPFIWGANYDDPPTYNKYRNGG